MKKQRITYALDWLQVYCISKVFARDYLSLMNKTIISPVMNGYGYHNEYTIIKNKEVIVGYEWQATIVWKEFTIATIAAVPRDKKKDVRGCAIKMANPVLYTSTWYDLLNDLAIAMQWEIHNITRVDIAGDFNYFWHGLDPRTFIRTYLHRGKAGYIKIGTNKFTCNGERDLYHANIDTIRFGSRQSGVSVYLYNKSKELKDKKDKPWIRKTWELANLRTDAVWRLEFSITNQGAHVKRVSDGLLHTLFHDDLSQAQNIKEYFHSFADKFFHFKHIEVAPKNGKQKKKSQMKDVVLFNPEEEILFKPKSVNRARDTGRTEKMISNRLMQEYEYIMSTDRTDKYTLAKAIITLKNYSDDSYTIKRNAAENEKAIEELAKKFSAEYLRQRLRITWITRRDAAYIKDLVTASTEKLLIRKDICKPTEREPIFEGTTIVAKPQLIFINQLKH